MGLARLRFALKIEECEEVIATDLRPIVEALSRSLAELSKALDS